MKKTTNKFLALLLGTTLVCAMFTGCGNTSEQDGGNSSSDGSSSAGGDTSDLVNSFIDSEDEPKETVSLEYDPNGTVVPGTYVFDDYKADMDFSIMWNFVLHEDGSYELNEDNPFIGVVEYAGQTSETDGNRVICGAMDADKATKEGDWAYPTGFSILVNSDDMTFQPENISDEVFGREEGENGEPAGGPGGPQDAAASQVFIYDDYKEMVDAHIIWTLTVNEDGSFTLSEDNPFGGLKEYAGKEAKVEGDQIVCGPMDPAPEQGDWAFPDGFTVQVTGEGTFEPTVFEQFGESGPNGGPGGPGGGPDGGPNN